MKKTSTSSIQLSLFNEQVSEKMDASLDGNWKKVINQISNNFEHPNSKQNENHVSKTTDGERPVHDRIISRNGVEIRTPLEGKAAIRPPQGRATGAIPGDDGDTRVNSIPSETNGKLLQPNGQAHPERLNGNGSRRDRMEGAHPGSRPVKTPDSHSTSQVTNFHSEVAPYESRSFTKSVKYSDNINALDLLIKLDEEQRTATPEEQITLAKYVGWGGLKEILLDPAKDADWKTDSDIQLRNYVQTVYDRLNTLDPDGSQGMLDSAKRSIINAHYTSYDIINSIYDSIRKAGFKRGNILEPSAGIGNFLAAMPIEMANDSEVTAIEMDRITGKILQRLFPTAETHVTGFEKIALPDNHYDLIISNVPFGSVPIYDTQLAALKDKRFKEASGNIHNYFFAKSIHLAKPGSMVAFITSRYTLDSQQNQDIRNLINDTCEFCGAIRLPDNAFQANAGTQVVTDIIFLRKFKLGEEKKQKQAFLNVKSSPFTDHKGQSGMISYNEYFHNNPSHLIGKVEFGGLYSKDDFNLKGDKSINLREKINLISDKLFPEPVLDDTLQNTSHQKKAEIEHFLKLNNYDAIGNLVALEGGITGIISDKFYVDEELDEKVRAIGIDPNKIRYHRDQLTWTEEEAIQNKGIDINDFYYRLVESVRIKKDDIPKVALIQDLRRKAKELIYKEGAGYNDDALTGLRASLKSSYNDFKFRYGNILDKSNDKLLSFDSDKYLILSLEKKDGVTGKISPSDILSKRTIHPVKEIYKTDKVQDAISLSIQKFGKLNINYVSELLDQTYEQLMSNQKGDNSFIFKDENGNHLTREEYLSGNVVDKLKIARGMVDEHPDFQNNVEQLEKVQPKPIAAVDIYAPMNARWIPENYLNQFLQDLLKTNDLRLHYSKSADVYSADIFDRSGTVKAYTTNRKSAQWVINHALNGVEPKVTYTVELEGGKTTQQIDVEDTQLAKDIYRKVKAAWDEWKYIDYDRRQHLASVYNKLFNNTVLRKYDGSHMNFPGMIGFIPRPHQKDAIFRNVQQFGGINDHMVGAGKTLIQIATAMELRRLGMANKPLMIGLKSQIPQLYEQFKKAYPLAKVLFPTEKDFEAKNRKTLLNNIATNDWDAIILSHDQFSKIKQPVEIQVQLIKELTDVIKEEITEAGDKQEKKRLENRLYKYEQKIATLLDAGKDKDVLDFSQLGIDFLMVDESQEFKNLEFSTTKKNVRGLGTPAGSKKAFNMLVACRHLQKLHGGDKGIIFSSGTPISNSMAELYLLFKYLRPNRLAATGITSFDRWAANFANDYSDLEYYMGKFKEVHRFREFANLPELLKMYQEIADVRNNTNLTIDKPKAEHVLVKIPPSEVQLRYIQKLQEYINSKGNDHADFLGLTAGYDDRKRMNPSFAILAINFAKKLSMDPRLIDSSSPGSKLEAATANIFKIYQETSHFKGTQLVFSDIGTPKSSNKVDNLYEHLLDDIPQSDHQDIFGEDYYEKKSKPNLKEIKVKIGAILNLNEGEVNDLVEEANIAERFNVYSEVKRLLVAQGIPAAEIAFIHDYNTRKQKEQLFDAVNRGEIRVVLGSTKKLGTGVNVQARAVAGHHLDISWRPSDLEQRNGRFERQGNEAAKEYLKNTVKAFYYATERTLDASMYNTVSQKAKFIAQLKATANPDIRIIKDIEEDIDMGSMAAELSGDPIFKEKANLQKRLTELVQLEKSFKSKKFDTENQIKRTELQITAFEEQVEILKRNIPLLDKIPKDEKGEAIFSGKVAGQSYGKVGEFGTALISEAEHAKKYKGAGHIFPLGELWGFKVIGKLEYNFLENKNQVMVQILSPNNEKIRGAKQLASGEVSAGLQVKQTILDMPKDLIRFTAHIEKENQNVMEYRNQLNEEFPYKEELTTKRNRLIEVDSLIVSKAKEVEENKKAGLGGGNVVEEPEYAFAWKGEVKR